MKRFTESFNPGNQLLNTGVTNHYTPIQNILTNIKNLFCLQLGIVANVGEDNVSIKLSSSQFTSQENVNKLLWMSLYNDVFTYGTSTLQGYITSQGLPKVSTINLGGYYVVYFSPDDIKQAKDPYDMTIKDECPSCPCPCETCESVYDEFEMNRIYEDDNDDQNDKDDNDDQNDNKNDDIDGAKHKEEQKPNETTIEEILKNEDKVKAAKQLEVIISQKINLPREYYFTAIKFKNEDEAIALRWKYEKKLPTGNSTENTRSLLHIFTSEGKIWVQDYAKDSIVELPKEVKTLIESILKILNAKNTNEPDVFELKGATNDSDENNDDQNQDDDNQNDENNDDQNQDDQNNKKNLKNKKEDKNTNLL